MLSSQDTQGLTNGVLRWTKTIPGRIISSLIVLAVTFLLLRQGYVFLSSNQASKIVQMLVAIVWGVGGIALLFVVANWVAEQLPKNWTRRLQPFIFVGPAVAMMGWFLAFPVVRTFFASFRDALGRNWVGLENYIFAFTDVRMLETFRNNLLWLVFGTTFSVGLGLLIAVLADRTRLEVVYKSIIFTPMAISSWAPV
jgi:alpha-glucoside transport system permease protein